MQRCFAYTRVSTKRQGEEGVSLEAQREAIERYAGANGLEIVEWFEETETAAKRGRPVFVKLLRLLRKRKAAGIVIHKIDRSARNLRDWADLVELADERGIQVHIAHEGLDLSSRGGRLSADIQAVVAADYIRNLRQEARKGFYGRLKQGIYPLNAPLGYVNNGQGGKVKTVDPVRGPLVRQAFEFYATGRYSLHRLAAELERRGLVTIAGRPVQVNRLSAILNNPFYAGVIRLQSTGETFRGIHEPLVSAALFERVRDVLRGRTQTRPIRHDFLFRRLLRAEPAASRSSASSRRATSTTVATAERAR